MNNNANENKLDDDASCFAELHPSEIGKVASVTFENNG